MIKPLTYFFPKRSLQLTSRDLNKFLIQNNYYILEGHSGENTEQQQDLVRLLGKKTPKKIAEIGFNAGHSSLLFLTLNKGNSVQSFDLMSHDYSFSAKKFIDKHFPKRHQLVKGDTKIKLPDFVKKHPAAHFDVVFIDGGHDFETAQSDLILSTSMLKQNGIVIMDDVVKNNHWILEHNVGPIKAWQILVESGQLVEIDHADYGPGRGMSVGIF